MNDDRHYYKRLLKNEYGGPAKAKVKNRRKIKRKIDIQDEKRFEEDYWEWVWWLMFEEQRYL